ncbi:hypothetical protein OBK30_06950 [Empedobacter falsenii]
MILNGKCKEKFLEWFSEPETYFYRLNNTCQNALIIEFFDSVGVYIEIIRNEGYFEYIVMEEWDYGFESRQEATIQAIKKANDIYNARFK